MARWWDGWSWSTHSRVQRPGMSRRRAFLVAAVALLAGAGIAAGIVAAAGLGTKTKRVTRTTTVTSTATTAITTTVTRTSRLKRGAATGLGCGLAVNTSPPCDPARPPANFCTTHRCVAAFATAKGKAIECNDQMWSRSGIKRPCAGHGGRRRGTVGPALR
ncbi:MAG: hypothetical protein JOZ25_03320 [Actinobacteria bacterium]|nr:hypothetical protein [Actinomycetota bacterium]